MARPWLDSDRGDQIFLFPVDSRDLLPKNHLVWGVMKVVDEFDLSQFEAVYHAGGVGRPPYSPRLMVALIVYCYLKGLRSERQIAVACYDDIGCRVASGVAKIDDEQSQVSQADPHQPRAPHDQDGHRRQEHCRP